MGGWMGGWVSLPGTDTRADDVIESLRISGFRLRNDDFEDFVHRRYYALFSFDSIIEIIIVCVIISILVLKELKFRLLINCMHFRVFEVN